MEPNLLKSIRLHGRHVRTKRKSEPGQPARHMRDTHEDLSQLLMAARLDVSELAQQPELRRGARDVISRVEAVLDMSIDSIRQIMRHQRAQIMGHADLHQAIELFLKECSARKGMSYTLHAEIAEVHLSDLQSDVIFRIVREALNNIVEHTFARNVKVDLKKLDDTLLLRIEDDGHGIDQIDMRKPNASGLAGMRERVWSLYGEIEIAGTRGQGTCITVVLPLSRS